ncbi:carbonic anhydrase [Amniculicola lignicola CBS 123094]|uniref:Carbonic anhydrase n=1 Tax=Amniculicola lignicola CBS 123094 TaxID=1392246 RepID=A0A6A5X3M7_9PLEO|nr:carbonic anhydrase [Amniculicola lignicola CBS 123094]
MRFGTLFLAGSASATCMHNLDHFKRAEGGTVEIKDFGYTGMKGPFNWAALAAENVACNTGGKQSPINIDEAVIQKTTEKPVISIPTEPVEFENLGTTIEVVMNGSTTFAGTELELKQFHFHTPSEHRIGEEYFPLEMHMVHQGKVDNASITVIAMLFELSTGASDPVLASLFPHLEAIATPGSAVEIEGGVDMSSLISHINAEDTELFQYVGSLTTPPCAEDITFLIASKPLAIDVDTYIAMKKIIKFNSRYTQNDLAAAENIITVGANSKFDPNAPKEGEEENVEGEPEASPTIHIAEISGVPLATAIVGSVMNPVDLEY